MTKQIRHGGWAGLTLRLAGLALTFALGAGAALAHASGRPASGTVKAARSARLHETILAAPGSGRTLYHLVPESPHHIVCTGTCAKLWPPLLVTSRHVELKAGAGVHGHLSIVHRPDGKLQVAFNGMPLYTFARDHRRGDVNGQGFGGVWFVLRASHATTHSAGNPNLQHSAAAVSQS